MFLFKEMYHLYYKRNLNFLLQQRAKENREARKKMISDEYRFIMGIVGSYIDLEVSAVEDFIVDSEEVRKSLVSLLYEY